MQLEFKYPSGIPVKDPVVIKYLFERYKFSLTYFANDFLRDDDTANWMMVKGYFALMRTEKPFTTEAHIRAFLFMAVRRFCLNYIRDHQKKIVSDQQLIYTEDPSGATVSDKQEREHTVRLLKIAFIQLPERHQQIFMLAMEGLNDDEIASILKRSKKYIQNRKSEGLKMLRKILVQSGYNGNLDSFLQLIVLYSTWMAIDFYHFIKN